MKTLVRNETLSLRLCQDLAEIAETVAEEWIQLLRTRKPSPLPPCIALSGGRTAQPLYEAVVRKTQNQKELWREVHFFFADERWVPFDHSDSNYRIAQQYLFDPLEIPTWNRHGLYIGPDRDYACAVGQADLVRLAPASVRGQPMLDLLLLGMGEDGHIASIFPDTPRSVAESQKVYVPVDAPKPPPERISLTLPVMQETREAWVLIVGEGKEEALRRSLDPVPATPLGELIQRRQALRLPTRLWLTCDLAEKAGLLPETEASSPKEKEIRE